MKNFKYILKRLKNMDYLSFFATVKKVSLKCNRNSFIIFCDIIYCGIKYMAGYVDYEVFELYNMDKFQRKTILTRGINNSLVKTLNKVDYFKYIDDKILFNEKYKKFVKRNWIDLRNTSLSEFSNFLKENRVVMAKTVNLCCGRGIEKLFYKPNINFNKLYLNLKKNEQYLIEQYVVQHDELNRLYPESVNTLRIVTLLKNGTVFIPFVGLRIGNLGNNVDNFNQGGLFARINDNGIIDEPAVDKSGKLYECHPYTNTKIIGYKIPLFNNTLSLVNELALITPEIRYTAWDIAICENGPIVIEGNPFPGHDLYQSKINIIKNKVGLLPTFEKILYS